MVVLLDSVGDDGGCILQVRVPQHVQLERALLLARHFCGEDIRQASHRITFMILQEDTAPAGKLPWRGPGSPQS